MARRKTYNRVIIVDHDNVPMVWERTIGGNGQLVYCTDERWQDEHTPVRSYAARTAKRLIKKTIENRAKWKMEPGIYRTMPFSG